MLKKFGCLFFLLLLTACAVNPVTGKNELALVGESTELKVGQENYLPSRQSQGGDYTTAPGIQEYVSEVGQRLARVSDRDLPYEFKVINDSTPNAWALPGGKIAVNRGLLTELNNEAELAAVLGHEIVHAAARHGAKGMERGMVLQGAVLAAGVAAAGSDYEQIAVGGAALGAGLLNQKYGRDAELESDYYGMQYMARAGYDPSAAIGLQETFVRLSEGRTSNWLSGLFASHPPSAERVEANRKTAKELGNKGELGEKRYRQVMAPLIAAREGYAAYDDGRQALSKGETEKALTLAEKALAIEPKEALFHALRGDIRLRQKRYQDAIINYDRALERNESYFYYYLQRGLVRQELGQRQQAERDLHRSAELLPTAPGLNALGELSLATGDKTSAKNYFSAAATSDSKAGRKAASSLARLDIADHPEKYLHVKLGLSRKESLVVSLTNTTELSMNNIGLTLSYRDRQGRNRSERVKVPGDLAGRESIRIDTGIGPLADKDQQQSLRVTIDSVNFK